VAAVADAKPEVLLAIGEYLTATGSADQRQSKGAVIWGLAPIQAYADGAVLFLIEASFNQPPAPGSSQPDGEIVFWPDPKDKKSFRRLGDTAHNPFDRWAYYLPVAGGERLLRVERFKTSVELIEVHTGAKREIALPPGTDGQPYSIEYGGAFDAVNASPCQSLAAAIGYQDRSALAAADVPDEKKIQEAMAEAVQAGDLSVMNRMFNGTIGVLALDLATGQACKITLERATTSADNMTFSPDGKLLAFSMAWRDPRTQSLWLCDPSGEGMVETQKPMTVPME
jgi:hypothetical protein